MKKVILAALFVVTGAMASEPEYLCQMEVRSFEGDLVEKVEPQLLKGILHLGEKYYDGIVAKAIGSLGNSLFIELTNKRYDRVYAYGQAEFGAKEFTLTAFDQQRKEQVQVKCERRRTE